MPAQARLGDKISISCPHGAVGTIISGSPISSCDGRAIARMGDIATCDSCGETFTIISGSLVSSADGRPRARVGDSLIGTCNPGKCKQCAHGGISATIITGSPITEIGI